MFRKLLCAVLLLAPAVAHADWYEASTSHFTVYSEQRPDRLKQFAGDLERFDKVVRLLVNKTEEPVGKANRVTVYVVDDTGDVVRLIKSKNVAGFYMSRAGGSLAVVPRFAGSGRADDLDAQAILQHEYTHHLMWSFSPHTVYPAWYIEGYAETFATTEFRRDGSIAVGTPPQYRGYGLLSGNALPIEKMLVADTLKLSPQQREGLYGRGWLLTHYLLLNRARPGQLNAYLTALNAGKPPLEAAAAFGNLRALDSELERYKLGKLKGLLIKPENVAPPTVDIRKLTPGEAATMEVRIRSKVGVDRTSAPAAYAAATKAAAPFPNDVGAQLVLAEAAYDAHDYAVAEAAADRAIAADSKSIEGYRYKAMTRMALARAARDRKPETLVAIRRIISTANRLDPDDPRPLILYFRSFVDFGQAPTDIAKKGLLRAFDLAPQDKLLRFNAARVILREGDKAEARAMLAALAYQPHGEALAKRAAGLIAMIDAGNAESAAKAMDAEDSGDDAESNGD